MLIIIDILGIIFLCFVEGRVKKVVYPCILVLIPKDYILPGWVKKWVDRFVNMGYVLFTYITRVSLNIYIDIHYNPEIPQEKLVVMQIFFVSDVDYRQY